MSYISRELPDFCTKTEIGNGKLRELYFRGKQPFSFRTHFVGDWRTSRKNLFRDFFVFFEWNARLSHKVVNLTAMSTSFWNPVNIDWFHSKRCLTGIRRFRTCLAEIGFKEELVLFNNATTFEIEKRKTEKFNENASIQINSIDWTSTSRIHFPAMPLQEQIFFHEFSIISEIVFLKFSLFRRVAKFIQET